jgi:peptide/nickel transport system substrate-binding protein
MLSSVPQAICQVQPGGFSRNLIINRDAPPFDNPELRRAMALGLGRKAFIDIINEGQGDVGGAMQPLPEGLWGMPPEVLYELPGYDPDVQKNRATARQIMQGLGYGPGKRLTVKLATRNDPLYRNPAVILIDQLKEIGIDGELDVIDTTRWFPKVMRKDYMVGMNATAAGVDDPDQQFTRTTPAIPHATSPATAILSSISYSISSRSNPIREGARNGYGRLNEN